MGAGGQGRGQRKWRLLAAVVPIRVPRRRDFNGVTKQCFDVHELDIENSSSQPMPTADLRIGRLKFSLYLALRRFF